MNANLIFKWLNDPRFSPDGDDCDAASFLPVEIRPEAPVDSASLIHEPSHTDRGEQLARLEITLPDGVRLKVQGGFDGDELARLVKGLIT